MTRPAVSGLLGLCRWNRGPDEEGIVTVVIIGESSMGKSRWNRGPDEEGIVT